MEVWLLAEAKQGGFKRAIAVRGGVTIWGGWDVVWRANLTLRGASKVLARIGEFRAFHLAQLDKRARKFPWGDVLTHKPLVKVEVVTNKRNKIYHSGAAVERIERAIFEEFGAKIAPSITDADIVIKVRIENNNVILSVDTSGEGLHKRGHKQAMGKAPMRETMAALLLRGCGYTGEETVLDPMCGSGTFLIEAAEISRNMLAGRARNFAFEQLANYDEKRVQKIHKAWHTRPSTQHFYGSDRNANVIEFANANARRAGVDDVCNFHTRALGDLIRPDGPAGLVLVNPPYGTRLGEKQQLLSLYSAFGDVMQDRFSGWRIAMVCTDRQLAAATKLPWHEPTPPIAHGGLKINLYQTDAL